MNKTLCRERLFQLVFSNLFTKDGENLENTLCSFKKESNEDVTGGKVLLDDEQQYVRRCYQEIMQNYEELKSVIDSSLNGYNFDKLYPNDKALLLVAVYELNHTDTPQKVVINEAVVLAKKFGGQKSSGFVNGVLSGVLNKINE